MPRKRKRRSSARTGDEAASTLLVLVCFAIFALALIALVAGWIICEIGAARFRRVRAFSCFALRPDEQETLTSLYERYIPVRRARNAILERGQNVPKRADGLFDERSTVGRDLNRQLTKIDPQYEALRKQIQQVRDLPFSRLYRFETWLHFRKLFRLGLVLMFAISVTANFAVPVIAAKFGHVFTSKVPQLAIYGTDQTIGAFIFATYIAAAFVAFASALTEPKEIMLTGSTEDFGLKTAFADAQMSLGEYKPRQS